MKQKLKALFISDLIFLISDFKFPISKDFITFSG